MMLALVLLAAAAVLVPPLPAQRISTTKVPRDGPAKAKRAGVDRHRMASDIELFAACFRAGLGVDSAVAAVAESYGDTDNEAAEVWRTVASLSALGTHTGLAWSEMQRLPGGAGLANLVALSGASGAALAGGCERLAAELRDAAADDATAAAERAGVLIAIPLTAFFLPAFFVLGLAPVVIGLARTLT
ncbi:type II secretion system F family protein [Corynebacterium mayonis]|uniref:type II secretion system F family protein n=1 Tax=Corynebacterium mayonis TaxID=3062461 RepID=UPI003140B692